MSHKLTVCITETLQRLIEVDVKIGNRSATEMYQAIHELYEHFPKDTFKTYTVDRGKEFDCYAQVEEELEIPVYFADAS